jgi:hypothetical protein
MELTAYGHLTRHFFRGFLENDLLTPDEGMQATLAPVLAGIAAPGLLLPAIWSFSYGWPFRRADEFQALAVRHELLFVVLSMIVVGLVIVLQWEALYPDRRDYAVLGPLPVSLRTVFLAKVSALSGFVGLFAVSVNGLSSICYPVVANIRPQPGSPGVVGTFVAHVAATSGGALFMALAVLAGLGLMQLLLPAKLLRPAASLVQLGSVLALVLGLLTLPLLVAMVDHRSQGRDAELVSLHRLFAEGGQGTYDWLSVPATSKLVPDTVHGGLRPRIPDDWGDVSRMTEAFPGEPASNVLSRSDRARIGTPSWLLWCPPIWFLAWYEVLAGRGGPTAQLLATRGLVGLAVVGFLALTCYLIAYARHAAGVMLGAAASGTGKIGHRARRVGVQLARLVVPDPVARACFAFTMKTVSRSPKHRLIVGAAAGSALAIVLAGLASRVAAGEAIAAALSGPFLLSVQLILVVFLLAGARVAFTVPSVLAANWSFRFHGPELASDPLKGVRRATIAFGVWPLLLVLAPFHAIVLGRGRAAFHAAFGLVVAFLILEILLGTFPKIPFATAYVPGKARLRTRLILYWCAFEVYVYSLAHLENWALERPRRMGLVLGAGIGLYAVAVGRRRSRAAHERLVYDEEPPDAIQTLGLIGPPPRRATGPV